MLTRDAANLELKKVVKKINPAGVYLDEDNDFYLDELLRVLPQYQTPVVQRQPLAPLNPAEISEPEEKAEENPAPPAEAEAPLTSEEIETNKKLTLLRDRLRNILASELSKRLSKSFCDEVFALQILLARISPVNKSGPTKFLDVVEYDDIEGMYDENKSPDTLPVFFSDGTAMSRSSAQAYFGKLGCYNKERQLKDINNNVLSARDIKSIKDQHVTIIPRPSSEALYAHNNDMTAGMILGYKIGIAVSITVWLMALFSVPALPVFSLAALLVGVVAAVYSGNNMNPLTGFVLGFGFVTFVGGLVNVVLTPVLAITSAFNLHAAIGIESLFNSLIIPYLVPALVLGAATVSSYTNNSPLARTILRWVTLAIILPISACVRVGKWIENNFPRLFPGSAVPANDGNNVDNPPANDGAAPAPGSSHLLMHQRGIADLVEPRNDYAEEDLAYDGSAIEIVTDVPSSSEAPALAVQPSLSTVPAHDEERNYFSP